MAEITTKNIIGEKTMKELNQIEELILLKDVRVKEAGEETVTLKKSGSTVKVKGNDKAQLLASKAAKRKDEPKEKDPKK